MFGAVRFILPFLAVASTVVPSVTGLEQNRAKVLLSADTKKQIPHRTLYDFTAPITTNTTSDANIIGGDVAPFGKYPTFASSNGNFVCGAVLIWPDVLLSAAHCVDAFNHVNAVAYIGGSYVNATRGASGSLVYSSNAPETIAIQSVWQHPEYDEVNIANDVLLIFLQSSSNATASKWNSDPAVPFAGQKTAVIGHGRTSDLPNTLSRPLKEASVSVVTTQECAKSYGSSIFPEQVMCAAFDTGTICNGDSGGPLLDANGVVLGIVSFARVSSCTDAPNGYARVSTYANWITHNICQLSAVPLLDPPAACAAAAAPTGPPTSSAGACGLANCQRRNGRDYGSYVSRVRRGSCQSRCVKSLRLHLALGWKCGGFCGE